jgi:hypothetical protein
MVYSTADRLAEPLAEHHRRAAAKLRLDGRATIVSERGVVMGRSRDCDLVLEDPNVSRKHAEVRPSGGSWVVRDLGSTNGIRVNGRKLDPEAPRSRSSTATSSASAPPTSPSSWGRGASCSIPSPSP